uniref:Uncharacterized protein n=1 Tax=Triticum urartu TaxID=4572 RepID=A0A8R7TIW9_TRIUA
MLPVMKAEASIMKMSRRVADTESSSNGEVALLEELEDELVNFGMSSSSWPRIVGEECIAYELYAFFGSSVLPITSGLATYRFLGPGVWNIGNTRRDIQLQSSFIFKVKHGYAISCVAAC